MSTNRHGIIAAIGRAHCQRQVAFLCIYLVFVHISTDDTVLHHACHISMDKLEVRLNYLMSLLATCPFKLIKVFEWIEVL